MDSRYGRFFGWVVNKAGAWGLGALLFLLVGLVTLPFGIFQEVHDQHFRDIAKSTQGVVLTQEVTGSRGGGTIITFTYRVQGHDYSATESAPNFAKLAGTTQTVLYDPANPSDAKLANTDITDEGEVFSISIFFILASAVLFLIGVAWRAIRKPRR